MAWMPATDFEEEIVSLQPDHNFIFGRPAESAPEVFYPRPQQHLDFVVKQQQQRQQQQAATAANAPSANQKLNVIAAVQRITGTKPLGELPTVNDWESSDHVEAETIAMMRHCGLGPSIERPLDEKCTLPTLPVEECIFTQRKGNLRMPIIFDDNFFKWELDDYISTAPDAASNKSNDKAATDSLNSSSAYSTNSQSFSTADDEDVAAKVRPKFERNTSVDYEKLPDTTNGSSGNILYESALGETDTESERRGATSAELEPEQEEEEEENSFETPGSSGNFISSQSWYRSDAGRDNLTNDSITTGSNGVNSANNSSSSSAYYSYPEPQRLYTAKELYKKKRHNPF